jgi:hypothetical protein
LPALVFDPGPSGESKSWIFYKRGGLFGGGEAGGGFFMERPGERRIFRVVVLSVAQRLHMTADHDRVGARGSPLPLRGSGVLHPVMCFKF